MKFDKFDFSLPLFCKAVRYQIRKSYQLFYLLSSSMFYQEFSFVCLEDVHYTKVTLNSPHSSHIIPNDLIGSNQLPIVLLFAASEIIWVLAPHERIFQKYFIADVLCLWGTPPSAWNIVVRCSSRGSIIPSLGTSKEVRGSWVEGLFAGCATHVRYERSLTHRHRLLFSLPERATWNHLVFIESMYLMLTEQQIEDLTIPVPFCILQQFWNALSQMLMNDWFAVGEQNLFATVIDRISTESSAGRYRIMSFEEDDSGTFTLRIKSRSGKICVSLWSTSHDENGHLINIQVWIQLFDRDLCYRMTEF